jgi:hypothetical protein
VIPLRKLAAHLAGYSWLRAAAVAILIRVPGLKAALTRSLFGSRGQPPAMPVETVAVTQPAPLSATESALPAAALRIYVNLKAAIDERHRQGGPH